VNREEEPRQEKEQGEEQRQQRVVSVEEAAAPLEGEVAEAEVQAPRQT